MATLHQQKLQNAIGDGARSTNWKLICTFPKQFTSSKGSVSEEDLDYCCQSASIPDIHAKTAQIDIISGRQITLPLDFDYTQKITLSFIISPEHKLRECFFNWIRSYSVFDFDGSVSQGNAWLNNSLGSFKIIQYDFDFIDAQIEYMFYNVFPTSLSAVDFTNESSDIIKITVDFNFTHYTRSIVVPERSQNSNTISTNIASKVGSWASDLAASAANAIKDKIVKKFVPAIKAKISNVGEEIKKKFIDKIADFKPEGTTETFKDFLDDPAKFKDLNQKIEANTENIAAQIKQITQQRLSIEKAVSKLKVDKVLG